MNRSTFLLLNDTYTGNDIYDRIKSLVNKGVAMNNYIGNADIVHFDYRPLKDKPVSAIEKQQEPDENEFIFVKDTADFVIQIKQIISRNLGSSDNEKIIAAHNLDFFLTSHNCSASIDVESVHWDKLFFDYHDNPDLYHYAEMIHLDCMLTRLEAHFKERYKEFK